MKKIIKIKFERRIEPNSEVMLHVSCNGNNYNLGWYRYDDEDNLVEIASILSRDLERKGFAGDIVLLSDRKDKIPCELFQSDLRERYSYGNIILRQSEAQVAA
jgi:hypothetical protein